MHIVHQNQRGSSRYGLDLSPDDFKTMENMIKTSSPHVKIYQFWRNGMKTAFLPNVRKGNREENTRIAGEIFYKGKTLLFVFRTTVGEIVTFLHPDSKFNNAGYTTTHNLK